MKITKSQLKALIREQVSAVIDEAPDRPPWDSEADEWYEDRFIADQGLGLPDDEDDDGKPKATKQDPLEQSARGKYRKGKTTDFKEDMKDVARLMSKADAYQMPPDAMQRLMRVFKELAPELTDEELVEFAKDVLKEPSDENPYAGGFLDSALGAPEEVGLQEEENNPWAICTSSVGREDKEKYEKCVKSVKKK
tara:strand:+ start:522 stop:1103 length:582 start_codon:yes stop_codon:yes gene_type:complete